MYMKPMNIAKIASEVLKTHEESVPRSVFIETIGAALRISSGACPQNRNGKFVVCPGPGTDCTACWAAWFVKFCNQKSKGIKKGATS